MIYTLVLEVRRIERLIEEHIPQQIQHAAGEFRLKRERPTLVANLAVSQIPVWVTEVNGLLGNGPLLAAFQQRCPWWTTTALKEYVNALSTVGTAATAHHKAATPDTRSTFVDALGKSINNYDLPGGIINVNPTTA